MNSRIAYFLLGVVGGLVAGGGAMATWRTVEMGGAVATKGVDTSVGKIALALSIATIILTLVTRKGTSEEPRGWPITAVAATGLLLVIIGGTAAAQLDVVYRDTRESDAARLSQALSDAGHETTPEELLEQMDQVGVQIPGLGPWVLLAGGFLTVCAAVSGSAWKRAWTRASPSAAAASEPPAE